MALCVRPLMIGSQGNDLQRAPYPKCVPFCPNSNTAIVARPRKRQQQTVLGAEAVKMRIVSGEVQIADGAGLEKAGPMD
jgi:hypothetical protein